MFTISGRDFSRHRSSYIYIYIYVYTYIYELESKLLVSPFRTAIVVPLYYRL